MEYRRSTFRWLLPALGVSLVSLALTEMLAKSVPEGIPAGPWILTPAFWSSYQAETNVFRKPDGVANDVDNDRIATFGAELFGIMPFRNSQLELGYRTSKDSYQSANFSRELTKHAEIDLELNFKSGDTLGLRDFYREDFARSEDIDAGGELVFEGEPYTLNRWEVEFSRDDPERQGYLVRVRRQDFNYDEGGSVGFFDYRGFDNVFEYRQPLPGFRRWLLRYNSRRFSHYDSQCKTATEDEPCQGDAGVPFRKELSDSFEFGFMGTLGNRQPYTVRLGYSSFRYEGTGSSDYKGVVGNAAWRVVLGSRTDLQLRLARRALPSNFETYYINNAIRAKLKREWLRFESSVKLEYDLNSYGDPVPAGSGELCDRRDSTYRLDVDWAWRMHERFKFEISAFHTNRRSTCENSDFQATGLGTGIALGW